MSFVLGAKARQIKGTHAVDAMGPKGKLCSEAQVNKLIAEALNRSRKRRRKRKMRKAAAAAAKANTGSARRNRKGHVNHHRLPVRQILVRRMM